MYARFIDNNGKKGGGGVRTKMLFFLLFVCRNCFEWKNLGKPKTNITEEKEESNELNCSSIL